jgi:hypothetical protein
MIGKICISVCWFYYHKINSILKYWDAYVSDNRILSDLTVGSDRIRFLGSYMSHRGTCSIGKGYKGGMEKKMILRWIRTTHLLLFWQSSYSVRLEGHLNLSLALEYMIINVNIVIRFLHLGRRILNFRIF